MSVAATVIIPARDAARTLPAALAALARQECDANFEVLVVDDASRDDTARVAAASAIGARVLRGTGAGPAAARNLGAAHARGAVLAFTDADCEPAPDWLRAGLEALDDADLVQGQVLPPVAAVIGPYDRYLQVTSDYGLHESANLLIRRDLFEQLGGFESILIPRRGIELGEDVWLGWRARRSGARTRFRSDVLVHHAVFRRGARGYVAERARLRHFPALARRVPELRQRFFTHRVFLNARSARFDLALAAVATAAASRRVLPLVAVLPYARTLRATSRGWPRPAEVAAVQMAADLTAAAALAYGSLRSRTVLL